MSTFATVLLTLLGVLVLAGIMDAWFQRNRNALRQHREAELRRRHHVQNRLDTWA